MTKLRSDYAFIVINKLIKNRLIKGFQALDVTANSNVTINRKTIFANLFLFTQIFLNNYQADKFFYNGAKIIANYLKPLSESKIKINDTQLFPKLGS